MSACGILQTDLYQSEFESRHLNNTNVSDYLTTTQMEISAQLKWMGAFHSKRFKIALDLRN